MKAGTYHPGKFFDNSKAIAGGDLQVLVGFLRELAEIAWQRGDAAARDAALLDRAMAARVYGLALSEHLRTKTAGRPREAFTMADAIRALEAARAYEAEKLKGDRPADRIEKDILDRFGITRRVLRDARNGKLPPGTDLF